MLKRLAEIEKEGAVGNHTACFGYRYLAFIWVRMKLDKLQRQDACLPTRISCNRYYGDSKLSGAMSLASGTQNVAV